MASESDCLVSTAKRRARVPSAIWENRNVGRGLDRRSTQTALLVSSSLLLGAHTRRRRGPRTRTPRARPPEGGGQAAARSFIAGGGSVSPR